MRRLTPPPHLAHLNGHDRPCVTVRRGFNAEALHGLDLATLATINRVRRENPGAVPVAGRRYWNDCATTLGRIGRVLWWDCAIGSTHIERVRRV